MNRGLLIIFLGMVLLTPSIIAVQPTPTVYTFPEGYIILPDGNNPLKTNSSYIYNFFLYNSTTGDLMDNSTINCTFFLAQENGTVLLIREVDYNSEGYWDVLILGGNFSTEGEYPYGVSCVDGTYGGSLSHSFEVTTNGKTSPEGIIIVVYSLLFFALFFFGILYFFKSLEHMIGLELDLFETITIITSYLAMWVFYYFSWEYLGNSFMNGILELAINIGSVTHVFLPLAIFMLSFIMENLRFKQKSKITY